LQMWWWCVLKHEDHEGHEEKLTNPILKYKILFKKQENEE
jgi:hypothetical protein